MAKKPTNRTAKIYWKKKLHKLLSNSNKLELLTAIWVIDRVRMDSSFVIPHNFNYPAELVSAPVGEPGHIFSWELETILVELFTVKNPKGRKILQIQNWNSIAAIFNILRKLENEQYGKNNSANVLDEITKILYRQLNWQVHSNLNAADAVRWWSIISTPSLRAIFEKNTKIGLKQFLNLSLGWNSLFNIKPRTDRPVAVPSRAAPGSNSGPEPHCYWARGLLG